MLDDDIDGCGGGYTLGLGWMGRCIDHGGKVRGPFFEILSWGIW